MVRAAAAARAQARDADGAPDADGGRRTRGAGPALASSRLALQRAADDRLVATGAVPIGALPAGDYVVRGTIGIEDGPSGTVIRTLRKK